MIPLTIWMPVAVARAELTDASLARLLTYGAFDVQLIEERGCSEVARARNLVATKAIKPIGRRGGVVLWLDADMVAEPKTVLLHAQLAMQLDTAISGRAVMRSNPNKVAASIAENESRTAREHQTDFGVVQLTPILCGLGCLMMPAHLFLEQAERSPWMLRDDGTREALVCCPRIQPHATKGHLMVSEDHAYGEQIPGGAWLAKLTHASGTTWLDYGHVISVPAFPAPGDHLEISGSAKP
jgi:hypothetical protein